MRTNPNRSTTPFNAHPQRLSRRAGIRGAALPSGGLGRAILGAAALVTLIPTLHADTFEEWELRKRNIRVARGAGEIDRDEEVNRLNEAWADYIRQQRGAAIPIVGTVAYASVIPVAEPLPGAAGDLTFFWLDPATEGGAAGPAIASVSYFVNTAPDTDNYDLLGTSFDSATDFSLEMVTLAPDADIRAVPFDAGSNPIVIAGLEGQNVASSFVTLVSLPEPASVVLLAAGGLFAAARRRARA